MTVAVGVLVAAFLAQNAPENAPATATTHAAKAASGKPSPVPANQWFTMNVVADGFHARICVDVDVVADCRDNDHIASDGRIRLQVGNPRTVVKIRKVRIWETR
jgi:hypothetical protein